MAHCHCEEHQSLKDRQAAGGPTLFVLFFGGASSCSCPSAGPC